MKTLIEITPTIEWNNGKVRLIDQTKLPLEEKYIETDWKDLPSGFERDMTLYEEKLDEGAVQQF